MSGPRDDMPPGPAPPQDESNPGEEMTGKDPSVQVSSPHGSLHTVMKENEEEKKVRRDDVQQLEDIHGDAHTAASHHSDLSSVLSKGSLHLSDLNAVPEPKHDHEVQRPASAEIREFLLQTQLQASRASPEKALQENITRMDAQIEAVQAQTAMAPKLQNQKLQSLRMKRQASKAELSEMLLRRASERVQETMQSFREHVLEHPSQWAGVQDIPDKMAAALKDYPPYKLRMHELMSHEIPDAHARSLWKTLVRELESRAEYIIDELHYHVVQQDEALDMEMIRMQAHIQQLKQFTDEGEKRPSTSERKQVLMYHALETFTREYMLCSYLDMS